MENKNNSNKRLESTIKYVDALSAIYSKLNVIRVDLSYKKPYSDYININEVNKVLNQLLNNRRSKPLIFRDNVGYVLKREYTKDKGVHIHAIFFFDGNKVQKSSYKADQIGRYWNEELTKNKGCYHNCNRNQYEQNGIGMIDHRDVDKRKILNENVISYLCKDEQSINDIKSNTRDKAFTKGTIPNRVNNLGRPRFLI